MKYNMDLPLCDHRGNHITEPHKTVLDGIEVVEAKPITLGVALERACIAASRPNAKGSDKFEQYKLAKKVSSADERLGLVELTSEEVTLLKELSGAIYSPIALGSVWSALENPLPHNLAKTVQ
jgi:hypothetical protein